MASSSPQCRSASAAEAADAWSCSRWLAGNWHRQARRLESALPAPVAGVQAGLAAGDWFSKSSEQFYTDAARSSDLSFNRSILTHRPRMRKLWVPEPYGRRPPFFLPVGNHER